MNEQLDQSVVALAKAVRKREGNASVAGQSGEFGNYQYTPDTWKAVSMKYLGRDVPLQQATLADQNEATYRRFKDWKDQGYNPGQIASMHNAGEGEPDAYTGTFSNGAASVGVNKYGVKYDVPSYAKEVAETYHSLKGGAPSQNLATNQNGPLQAPQGAPSIQNPLQAPAPIQQDVQTAYAAEEPPESLGSKAAGFGKSALEFLFPILEKKERTALQTVGDIGLSVLPFIPGVGAAGTVARGLKLGAEGAKLASTAAKGAKAAEASGVLQKLFGGRQILTGAASGYGTGVAQNLSEGNSVGESIAPNKENLIGAALGGGVPALFKAGGKIINDAARIPENIKPVLARSGNVKLYDEYINAAKKRAEDIVNPSPLEVAADYTEKATKKIQEQMKKVGSQVGDIKKAEGATKLADVRPVIQSVVDEVGEKFGMKLSVSPSGAVTMRKLPGRMKDILSVSDKRRIKEAVRQLVKLRKSGNVAKASDVLDNLDNLVDYSKKDLLGNSHDVLENFLKSTRHNLNGVVGQTSKKLATAKSRYSQLRDTLDSIGDAGGDNLQRAELLMKRVFSGDKSKQSREIFDIIKKETGIDLTEHAVMAKHAVDTIGDESSKTLLDQMLNVSGAKGAVAGGDIVAGLHAGKGLLRTMNVPGYGPIASPERIGRNIVKGKKKGGILPAIMTAGAIEGGRGI